MSTKLFIIATPIGNLSDLSNRCVDTLKDVDLIFAEDTRVTTKLLYHLGLKKKLVSCHKFNEKSRTSKLKDAFDNGLKVALVSDAGTPLVSDPGQRIVEEAIKIGFEVCAIPGPTAFVQALVGSGLPCEQFVFDGFLPDKMSQIEKHLMELKNDRRTLVFYISPHSIRKKLDKIQSVLGNRRACLAKELTKLHETYFRGTLEELPGFLNEENLRGEFTLVIEGATGSEQLVVNPEIIKEFVEAADSRGVSLNEIARLVKEEFGMKKSEAYSFALEVLGKK